MKSRTRHILATISILVLLAVGATAAFVWSGAYNIGADDPHWSATHTVIETLRERSISARLDGIQPPDLEDSERIRLGAVSYSAMCTGCHLSPGVDDTEIRPGLYPIPPNLAKGGPDDPRRTFWVIKHGIKMAAMPAWGKTHSDEQMWNMVAFVQKLPGMSPAQYTALGGKPPAEDEDHMHEGMDDHHAGATNPETAQTRHEATEAAQGEMHTHADGTRERHPPASAADEKPATVKDHADDGHQH